MRRHLIFMKRFDQNPFAQNHPDSPEFAPTTTEIQKEASLESQIHRFYSDYNLSPTHTRKRIDERDDTHLDDFDRRYRPGLIMHELLDLRDQVVQSRTVDRPRLLKEIQGLELKAVESFVPYVEEKVDGFGHLISLDAKIRKLRSRCINPLNISQMTLMKFVALFRRGNMLRLIR
jgi:hypothetical protein